MFALASTAFDRAMAIRLLTVSVLAPRCTPGELALQAKDLLWAAAVWAGRGLA